MPSATFFNLPAEKREKLLKAAREEFARVPFQDASINKIVRAAGIPRGSFYQYFTDKKELFFYLIGAYGEQLVGIMEGFLAHCGGDPFAAFLAFFDYIQADYRDPVRGAVYENIIGLLRVNREFKHDLFLNPGTQPPFIERLCAGVDESRLDLRCPGDLETMLYILVGATGPAIVSGILADDAAEARTRYVAVLDILGRGMRKEPAHSTQKKEQSSWKAQN